jgi:signal transduction histidine kinase/phosphatidylserine/phosphatidylglycerophosphate/cardiolipin synthase-like enzyme
VTAAEVYLPCDVGHVRVKLGFRDTLSPLEETALRVIAAMEADDDGARPGHGTDVRELASFLGLGYRVVLDLVHDLWRAGYLVVDFSSNAIGLSPNVRELLEEGRLTELAGVEAEDRDVELMVERLTGFVMPSRGPRAPGDRRLAVRFMGTNLGLADAGQAEVNQAIRSWLRYRETPRGGDGADEDELMPRGRERRILSVRAAPQDRSAPAGRRWYRLDVQAEINEASGRLIITVVDKRFPADRRELASDRLTRLAEEFPREPFVTRLRAIAEEKLVVPPPLEEVIDRLAARVADGESVPSGQRRREHLEWMDESGRIDGMIGDRLAHEVDAELVVGGVEHSAVVAQLIDDAQTQLVIACPWITDHGLERITPQLRKAIDRGVQVVIVWGIGHQATLPENVGNALDSLARQSRTAPMLRPQVSANTHAKLVVCDDRAALVTSRNVLSATRERPEAGLLLRVPDDHENAAIRDLLGWVSINMPGSDSRSVMNADRFPGRPAPAVGEPPGSAPRPVAPANAPVTVQPEEPTEDPDQPGAVRAWTLAWTEHIAALRTRLADRPRPAVRLVEDGAHRELLWLALRIAERRVVIASGQVTDEVVNERMVDAIGGLLVRGVAVTIGYDGNGAADRGQAALAALADLSATYPDLLRLNPSTGHAKVLVWDDDVVVGSFNYLSYSGYGSSGGRHLMRSELSVRLTSAALADSVAAFCGEPAEVTARVSGSRAEPAAAPPGFGLPAMATAQRILTPAPGQRPGTAVRAELAGTDDPWPVLEALERLGNATVRRSAIAYCLAYHAADVSADVVTHWRRRLVDELVCVGAFVEAAILRGADPDETASPRLLTLAALARRGMPDNGVVLFDAVTQDDLTADEQAALLMVATGGLLASGDDVAMDVVTHLAPAVNGPWTDLAGLTLEYGKQATGASIAELMRAIAGQRDQEERQQAAWDRLELALLEADFVPKNLDGARKTHAALFHDIGIFGRLRGIAARHDLAALQNLVEAELPARPRADELAGSIVDAVWRDVAPLNELLTGRPRAKYVRRLAEVVASARDLVAPSPPASDDAGGVTAGAPHPDLLAAARMLADGYRQIRPALTTVPGQLAAPAAEAVLADLDELMSGHPASTDHRGAAAVGDDILREWPGRWQYPELATELQAEPHTSERLPELLLRDLVDPIPPEETARRLIKAGEFGTVDALRERAGLAPMTATAILQELEDARSAAQARIRYDADALLRRARRAEVALTIDFKAIDEQAERRLADAEQSLREVSRRVQEAEKSLAEQLRAEAENLLAASSLEEELASGWLRSVQDCIDAREFAAARRLLDHDPADAPSQDPLAVPSLRPIWPFVESSAETAVSWYFEDASRSPVGFESWRPNKSDVAAWDALEALRGQLDAPSAKNAAALCGALQRLVGAQFPASPVVAYGEGWHGQLYLPDNLRLPQTTILRRSGVTLWIAGPTDPPPDTADPPILWLMTGAALSAAPPSATMVLDLPFLFRLVAPVAASGSIEEIRLVNLVRQLAAQLSAEMLLGEAQSGFSEPHMIWLLHVLGAGCDGVVAEAIYYETAGRRELLAPLLDALLTVPVPGHGRHQPIDVAALNAARQSGTWRAEALERLLAPHEPDTAALLVLRVAAAFEDDTFTLEDVRAGIRVVAPQEIATTVLASTDLLGAVRRLQRSALFEQVSDGLWRLPRDGIRDLLATEWPGHVPLAEATVAVQTEYNHHEEAAARTRAELSADIVKVIGHLVANRQAAARSARNRGDTDRAWQILDQVHPIHQMYAEAIGPVRALPLREVIQDHLNDTCFLNPGVETDLPDGPDLRVVANSWLLGEAFQNLFDNARQAVEESGREFGKLRVTITVCELAADGEPRCQIDIEDSGVGMPAQALERFAEGEPFSSRGGRGTGLLTARLWFGRYRGTLEIVDEGIGLGGAHVRVTLPLAPEDESG